MAVDVLLLRLGSTTMESAIVLEWLAEVGNEVTEGDPLISLETDKVEIELPAPTSGFLLRLFANPGDEIAVGGRLAEIGTQEELASIPEAAPDRPPAVTATTEPTDGSAETMHPVPSTGDPASKIRAAPPARRLAKELGIDLATITGTGSGGRIQTADVEAAHRAHPRATSSDAESSAAVRRRIAIRMAQSTREAAPVTLTRLVDGGHLDIRVTAWKDPALDADSRPSIEDLIIQICADALRDHPNLNGSWAEEGLQLNPRVNINVAVQGPHGLVVPVIRDADLLEAPAIAAERRRLTALALAATLGPGDVTGGTFTITNLGAFGVDAFTPIVTLPQVAVLGIGRMTDAVLPKGRDLVVKPALWLSLTFDHRAVDGAPAAAFLAAITDRIETPAAS